MKKLVILLSLIVMLGIPFLPASGTNNPSVAIAQGAIFSPFKKVGRWFKRTFSPPRREIEEGGPANVTGLTLDKNLLLINDKAEPASLQIAVSTTAFEPHGDPIIYKYTISAGVITGEGPNVVWDLADVGPGTYLITAGVDNGCGVCGYTKSETIQVRNAAPLKGPYVETLELKPAVANVLCGIQHSIEVFATSSVKASDIDYEVSGGKIERKEGKVLWNLESRKGWGYSITAKVANSEMSPNFYKTTMTRRVSLTGCYPDAGEKLEIF